MKLQLCNYNVLYRLLYSSHVIPNNSVHGGFKQYFCHKCELASFVKVVSSLSPLVVSGVFCQWYISIQHWWKSCLLTGYISLWEVKCWLLPARSYNTQKCMKVEGVYWNTPSVHLSPPNTSFADSLLHFQNLISCKKTSENTVHQTEVSFITGTSALVVMWRLISLVHLPWW